MISILHVSSYSDFILCHIFQLIALKHVFASSYGQQTAKDVRGSVRKAFVLDDSCIKSLKSVFFLL